MIEIETKEANMNERYDGMATVRDENGVRYLSSCKLTDTNEEIIKRASDFYEVEMVAVISIRKR